MLAFDIETLGLNPMQLGNCVTVASIYDPSRGISRTFNFLTGAEPEDFLKELDAAPRLCAFNGARFDIPFLAKIWSLPPVRVHAWMAKLFDVYEVCKLAANKTFSLNALLRENGLESKTGTGLEAVEMAKRGDYMKLESYCMMDTRLTHQVSSLERINVPKCRGLVFTPRGSKLFERVCY
jgi:hypothetical protein